MGAASPSTSFLSPATSASATPRPSLIFGFATLEGGVQAPIAGYLIDKYGPRVMTLIGATLAGIGFLLLPLASDLLSFVLIYVGVIALGINAGFHNSAGAIVNAWFVRRRGLAFGIISVGIALGGGVMTPIVAAVVLEWGWRWAVTLSGLMILIVGVPLSLFIRNKPGGRRPAPGRRASASEDRTVDRHPLVSRLHVPAGDANGVVLAARHRNHAEDIRAGGHPRPHRPDARVEGAGRGHGRHSPSP